jgi:hypothetical protein
VKSKQPISEEKTTTIFMIFEGENPTLVQARLKEPTPEKSATFPHHFYSLGHLL